MPKQYLMMVILSDLTNPMLADVIIVYVNLTLELLVHVLQQNCCKGRDHETNIT